MVLLNGFTSYASKCCAVVLADLVRTEGKETGTCFVRAGPRPRIVFQPSEVTAAIVTCGGLCPGLNDVVSEIVQMLYCK